VGFCDCHCHLDDPSFDGERPQLLSRCLRAGVTTLVTVADPYEEESLAKTLELDSAYAEIATMVAAHPHRAAQYSPQVERRIFHFVSRTSPLGIGEAGLDFHYHYSPPDDQRRVFRRQLAIASELRLPVAIHSREAEKEILDILVEVGFRQPVIFHCFTGDMDAAREIVSRGYFISFSGIVTFKKAESLRRVAETVPLGQLLTETDSPYLAPEPHRGQTNNPGLVRIVAAALAQLRGIGLEELTAAVEANVGRLRQAARLAT